MSSPETGARALLALLFVLFGSLVLFIKRHAATLIALWAVAWGVYYALQLNYRVVGNIIIAYLILELAKLLRGRG